MTPEEKLRRVLPMLEALAGMSDRTTNLIYPTQVRKQARQALDDIGEGYRRG